MWKKKLSAAIKFTDISSNRHSSAPDLTESNYFAETEMNIKSFNLPQLLCAIQR